MPLPQPQNFNDVTDFTSQIEKTFPGGWDKLDHKSQEMYVGHAIQDWNRYHQARTNIRADVAAEGAGTNRSILRPSREPAMSRMTGPETPSGVMAPTAGSTIASRFAGTPVSSSGPSRGEVDVGEGGTNAYDWLTTHVSEPMQRNIGVKGLAYMAAVSQGSDPGPWVNRVMSDPKLYNAYREVAQNGPLLGGTPTSQLFDGVMLGLEPALKAAGIALPAMEGAKIRGPLARWAMRTGITAGAGAATGIPEAAKEGSPLPLFVGAAKGAIAQQMAEGVSAVFGVSKTAARKAFNSDMYESLAGKGSYFKDFLGDKLRSFKDFRDSVLRLDNDRYGNAASKIENYATGVTEKLQRRANSLLGGTDFKVVFPNPEMLEEKGITKAMVGQTEIPAQAEIKPYTRPRTPPKKNPLWKPGPQAKGATMPKAPYWTKAIPPKQMPGRPAVEPGTFNFSWEGAFQTMRNWERRGWGALNDPKRHEAGTVARSLARFMRGELASQMDAIERGVGSSWSTAKTRQEAATLFSNIYSSADVLTGDGFNVPALQRVVAGLPRKGSQQVGSFMRDIIEVLGKTDGATYLSRVMHGAGVTAPKDVAGAISPYISGHMTGFRFGIHPTLPYSGADRRIDVGRGAWSLLTKMGAATFFKAIEDAVTDKSAESPEGMAATP